MKVHRASPENVATVSALLAREMYPEIGYGSIDMAKVVENVHGCATEGVLLVVVKDGEIAGTIGIRPSEGWWWSKDVFLAEQWVFVRPEYRKSRAAFLLLREAVNYAKEQGKPLLFGISSPFEQERKERLFSRFGKKAGCFYVSEA